MFPLPFLVYVSRSVTVNMFLAHTSHFNVCLVIRLLEQWVMTCRSVRLVQTVVSSVNDSRPTASGDFLSPSNSIAWPSSLFVDGVMRVTLMTPCPKPYVHGAAYTGASSGLNVSSASRGIEISNIPTLYCKLWWALMVLEAAVDRAFEATLGDVVTFFCEKRTAAVGGAKAHTIFSNPAKRCLLFPFENGRTSRAVKVFPLFFSRDHCQSAKASGTFCSPSRRKLLRTFAHIAQCCRFEASAHKGG